MHWLRIDIIHRLSYQFVSCSINLLYFKAVTTLSHNMVMFSITPEIVLLERVALSGG